MRLFARADYFSRTVRSQTTIGCSCCSQQRCVCLQSCIPIPQRTRIKGRTETKLFAKKKSIQEDGEEEEETMMEEEEVTEELEDEDEEAILDDNNGDTAILEDDASVESPEASLSDDAIDPMAILIKKKEEELSAQVKALETELRNERNALIRLRDRMSESGKNGYFIQQAKVADFLKEKEAEQKARVAKNKKEFVLKILPVVDSFREAPSLLAPTTEKEENMHKSYGSLLKSIVNVFDKYGYKEFAAEVGSKYDSNRHQVANVVEGKEDGIVVAALSSGMLDNENVVIRRALVNVSKVTTDANQQQQQQQQQAQDESKEAASEAEV